MGRQRRGTHGHAKHLNNRTMARTSKERKTDLMLTPCKQCKGACCKHLTALTGEWHIDKLPWAKMRGLVKQRAEDLWEWHVKSPCKHLDINGRCRIYFGNRPLVCKTFEVGSKECLKAIQIQKELEAIG